VVDKEISARECVDQQATARCWCPKAVLAVTEVAQIAVAGTRLFEQISKCKDAASAMFRKPAADRYDGPALRKVKGIAEPGEIPLPSSPQKSLLDVWREGNRPASTQKATTYMVQAALAAPAQRVLPVSEASIDDLREERIAAQEEEAKEPRPEQAPPICEAPTCRTALRPNNTTGLCQLHRNKITSRERHALVPPIVRAAGTARNALDSQSPDPDEVAAAMLAQRPTLAQTDRKICEGAGCTTVLARKTRGNKCISCLKRIKPGGGWTLCANAPRCPKLTQKLIDPLCNLCRRGKKYHLKEEAMKRCTCGKGIRTGRDGKIHDKCNRCRIKAGEIGWSRDRRPKAAKKATTREAKARTTEAKVPLRDFWVGTKPAITGLDPSSLTTEQLCACAYELRQRLERADSEKRAMEFALAGEQLTPKKATGT
jgi:hypothetical protein